jgi:hypothetical protein
MLAGSEILVQFAKGDTSKNKIIRLNCYRFILPVTTVRSSGIRPGVLGANEKGDVSHTVALTSQVLTACNMFTLGGEHVNYP